MRYLPEQDKRPCTGRHIFHRHCGLQSNERSLTIYFSQCHGSGHHIYYLEQRAYAYGGHQGEEHLFGPTSPEIVNIVWL